MPKMSDNQEKAVAALKDACDKHDVDALSQPEWRKHAAVSHPGVTISAKSLVNHGSVKLVKVKRREAGIDEFYSPA